MGDAEEALSDKSVECAICLETVQGSCSPTITLTCGHAYHLSCISEMEDSRCPMCRTSHPELPLKSFLNNAPPRPHRLSLFGCIMSHISICASVYVLLYVTRLPLVFGTACITSLCIAFDASMQTLVLSILTEGVVTAVVCFQTLLLESPVLFTIVVSVMNCHAFSAMCCQAYRKGR